MASSDAMDSVCVFAGSSTGYRDSYTAAAAELGTMLAKQGIHLVYGGGGIGGMCTLYEAVSAAGGSATGVIPRALAEAHDGELAETRLDDLRIVEGMHARKALMAELADAFIATPGGLGTLEEVMEVTTWSQLGLHAKPSALLNVDGYFDQIVGWLDHAVDEGFLASAHRGRIIVSASPAELLAKLNSC